MNCPRRSIGSPTLRGRAIRALLILVMLAIAPSVAAAPRPPAVAPAVSSGWGFVPSVRAEGSGVRFEVADLGSSVALTGDGVRDVRSGSGVRFHGVEANVKATGIEPLEGVINYMIGNDRDSWQLGLPTYRAVRYEGLYPGVDLEVRQTQDGLTLDLVAGHAVDLSAIAWQTEGDALWRAESQWANGLAVLDDGTVSVNAPGAWHRPLSPARVSLEVDFGTYLGGSGSDVADSVATDGQGNIYVSGYTYSGDLPVERPLQPDMRNRIDAFVAMLGASGRALVYCTYLGGSGGERAWSIAVDEAGRAFVAGETSSHDFPTQNPIQADSGGGTTDGFVAVISPGRGTPEMLFSTYVGGSDIDVVRALALDSQDRVYVSGETISDDYPVVNAFRDKHGGDRDAFVARIKADFSDYDYSTLIGGIGSDYAMGIAVDASGSTYVTGYTGSRNFPTRNPLQRGLRGGGDAFVLKLTSDGQDLEYSTFLGGKSVDGGNDIGVALDGTAYIVGGTSSADFPRRNAIQTRMQGVRDGIAARLAADGQSLVFSTFLGGSGNTDDALELALSAGGDVHLSGCTESDDFPVQAALQSELQGPRDGYVMTMTADGAQLTMSTYIGGSSTDSAHDIAVLPDGALVVVGDTSSTDFPTANGLFSRFGGGYSDAFILRLGDGEAPTPIPSPTPSHTPESATATPTQTSPSTSTVTASVPPTPSPTPTQQNKFLVYLPSLYATRDS